MKTDHHGKSARWNRVAISLWISFLPFVANAGEVGISSETPLVDGDDIANLTWSDTVTEKVFSDASNPGQTFTTGNQPEGYSLNSLSLQVNSTSLTDPEPSGRNYTIRVVEVVDGGATTTIAFEAGHLQSGAWSSGDWFTWTLDSPVRLSPNTRYGFDIEYVSGGNWRNGIPYLRYNRTDDVAGGSWYRKTDGDPVDIQESSGRDFVFHLDIGNGTGRLGVPEITSIVPISEGIWELTLEGSADTGYRLISSPTLDFENGIGIEGLTQGDEINDPGTVSGGNLLTTNGEGQGKVRVVLAGDPSNFVRAQAEQ